MAKRSLETLSREHRLELLIQAVVDYALYTLDPEGKIVSWNSGARRLTGYDDSEAIGRHFSFLYTKEDRDRGLPRVALAKAAQEGRFESEGWRIRKDGSRFWALAVADPIRDDDGTPLGFVKIIRDMTDDRLSQRRILESEARFRQLVEGVVDYAIFHLDLNGQVTTWNRGAERIKGYAPEEIIGSHFSRFYTEEARSAGVPDGALAAARREGKYEAEGWRVRKDGSRFWASVVLDALRNDDGEVVGFAKITRDITERMEAQRQLQETQQQLAASQKMEAIGQLSGGIAHDFNNLLMVVLGNLEIVQRSVRQSGDPHLQRALGHAARGAQRAAALTQRLLAFSRRQALNPAPTDVAKFVLSSSDFLARTLGETIEMRTSVAEGLWGVEVDQNQLEAALLNLAVNSRDAMPEGGKLTIEATNAVLDRKYCETNPDVLPGRYVALSVSDTGVGMPKDVLVRAFEPFFTTKELGHGTGLGLSQVYGFVRQTGGHITIYSEPGLGTTVKIYLPRLDSEVAQEQAERQSPPKRANGGASILVVEDNAELRLYLAEAVRLLGHAATTAKSGDEALGILAQLERRIDLMLTDVVMPGMTGFELGQRAKGMRGDLKIIYLTGYSTSALPQGGRLNPSLDVLQKPVTQNELATRIRDALRPSRNRAND